MAAQSLLTRRHVLAGLGALTVAGCGEDAGAPEASPLFPLGVASGDPAEDGALLWTRYGGKAPLELVVLRDGAEVHAQQAAATDGFVRLEVAGFAADTAYEFLFRERGGGAQSRTGRFRTALAPGARRVLRFGGVSCMKYNQSMAAVARAAARTDLDGFLLLGDNAYLDGSRTLDEYRASWARTLRLQAQRDLRATHTVVATWDDHEVANNWSLEDIAPAQLGAARRAFFDNMPLRAQAAAPARIWRSVRYGDVAEVLALDSRGERRPSAKEYLSRAQLDWLEARLAASPCVFKLVLTSVPVSSFPGAFFDLVKDDRWEGYPEQRNEVLSFVEQRRIGGVLWVAGDYHLASMGRVALDGPGKSAVEVLVGPGAQASNPAPSYPGEPQFDWASGVNNYAVLELDPVTTAVRIEYRDAGDRVLVERTYALGGGG